MLHPFSLLAARFVEGLSALHFSPKTCETYGHDVKAFLAWLSDNIPIMSIAEVTPSHLQQYQISVYNYQQPVLKNGKERGGLSVCTQSGRLVAIHKFFTWLLREQQIAYDPSASLQMPRVRHSLPRHILSPMEVDRLLTAPPADSPKGLRDRAILELFYRTGLRRAELLSLMLYDLDLATGTLFIRQGKGNRDRVVPILEETVFILKAYLSNARTLFLQGRGATPAKGEGPLFVSVSGLPLVGSDVGQIVRVAAKEAGITKRVTPHALRHTCATHLLQRDVDIRQIQKLLGHRRLSSTEIYTHVETSDLRAVLKRCHPRESVVRESDFDAQRG